MSTSAGTKPATPVRARPERSILPSTPSAVTNPVPSRTPRVTTPGGASILVCTTNEAHFDQVSVHTAKCTECDKRNLGKMLRCPGCTFQVCTPCYSKRQKEHRGLIHGTLLSGRGGAHGVNATSPLSARTVRKKPIASISHPSRNDSFNAYQTSDETATNGNKAERKQLNRGDFEVRSKPTPIKPYANKKKWEAPKQQTTSDTETASSLSDMDDGFLTDYMAPTPCKKQKTAPKDGGSKSLKSKPTANVPCSNIDSSGDVESSLTDENDAQIHVAAPAATRPAQSRVDQLMQEHGVNTPDNPYHEHFLSRRAPVVSNPVVLIPNSIKRSGKPRRTAQDIQQDLVGKVREKLLKKREEEERQLREHGDHVRVQAEAHARQSGHGVAQPTFNHGLSPQPSTPYEQAQQSATTAHQQAQSRMAFAVQNAGSPIVPRLNTPLAGVRTYSSYNSAPRDQTALQRHQALAAPPQTYFGSALPISPTDTISCSPLSPPPPSALFALPSVDVQTIDSFVERKTERAACKYSLNLIQAARLLNTLNNAAIEWIKEEHNHVLTQTQRGSSTNGQTRLNILDKHLVDELSNLMDEIIAREMKASRN